MARWSEIVGTVRLSCYQDLVVSLKSTYNNRSGGINIARECYFPLVTGLATSYPFLRPSSDFLRFFRAGDASCS